MAIQNVNSPAPWRNLFLDHLTSLDTPTCVFSTLHCELANDGSTSRVSPRSRTIVFRGMWASLPVHPQNPAPLNPTLYESDLLTFTNDARMEKTRELSNAGILKSAPGTLLKPQPGGGAPVEAVFWVVSTRTQWRIRGSAYVLGPNIDSDAKAPVKKFIQRHMRPTSGSSVDEWVFSREITAHFGNLSPRMRGSFKNPPPGTAINNQPQLEQRLGQKVYDLNDRIARENFRVMVIIPEEVDRLDLSNPEEGKRWNYKMVDGLWETTNLWP